MPADNYSAPGEELVRQRVISRAELDEAQEKELATGTPWYRQLLQSKKLGFDAVYDLLNYEFHSRSTRETHQMLGAALLEKGRLSEAQLQQALNDQRRSGKLLGDVLLNEGYVTREDIGRVLAEQYRLPYVSLEDAPSHPDALEAVPESVAKQKEFIPVRLEEDKLTVLIAGPQSPHRFRHIGIMLGVRLHPMMTAVDDIGSEIEARYRGESTAQEVYVTAPAPRRRPSQEPTAEVAVKEPQSRKQQAHTTERTSEPMAQQPRDESTRFDEVTRQAQGVSVVKLVATIIEGAVNAGATDVHLDPQEPDTRVRYRIDGVLHDVMSLSPDIVPAIVSRLKILADMDITETRRPQDGHISMEVGDAEFDIRVATMPTYLGERIVLRLLDQSSVLHGIKDLGLEDADAKILARVIEQPYGMILVTGPTGSGKTTTLYSCLNQIDVMTESVVTLEDPVEYQLSGINQVQIDPDIDLTFANVLRSAMRQDIDVLLVGEIRDPDTARIAVRASMTGHLVFSTLHTNDAPEAIATLRNMDVPSYLISSALTAVVAQRLVRIICNNCKTHFKPPTALLKSIGLPESVKRLYHGKGCEECYNTGTRGRTGIFEILEINAQIRKMIVDDEGPDKIMKAAKLKTMSDRCRLKVKQGVVAPEEFLRVIRT